MILLGPPSVGKTHLSVSLAEATIRAGLGASYMTAHGLVTDLGRAYRDGRLDRRMRVSLAPKVLIIDEMGYLPLDDLGATINGGWTGEIRVQQCRRETMPCRTERFDSGTCGLAARSG